MNTEKQQAAAAAEFAKRWEGRGYERGESQLFWADLLTKVYGVEDLPSFIRYILTGKKIRPEHACL